jgi:uncharacterized protein YbjT (DUF2867 family)
MSGKIMVLGATGSVGEATVRALAAQLGATPSVVVGARDVAKARKTFGPELAGLGYVAADMGGPEVALASALAGVATLFIVTPGSEDRVVLASRAIAAAQAAGVRFVLLLSVMTAGTDTIFGLQFGAIEQALAHSRLAGWCVIRLPLFIDNNFGNAASVISHRSLYGPIAPYAHLTAVAVADAASAATAVLSKPWAHAGRVYKVTSARYTHAQLADALADALGEEVRYVQVPPETAKAAMEGLGMPGWQAEGVLELAAYINEDSHLTNLADSLNDLPALTGQRPMTVQEWVATNAGAFR